MTIADLTFMVRRELFGSHWEWSVHHYTGRLATGTSQTPCKGNYPTPEAAATDALAALHLIAAELAGEVYDEFSAGHPVIEDEQIEQESACHADKAEVDAIVAGMIYDAELEQREQEAERDEERSVYAAGQR